MRSRKRTGHEEVELNITAFLNLMVVLIPFLLLNAVFAQVSILQLNLPSNEEAPPSDPEENNKPVLEVLIYQDRYEIGERKSGKVVAIVPVAEDGKHDREKLRGYLAEIKAQFPEVTNITLLCEDDTDYELMIYTMDAVRYRIEINNGIGIKKELFPEIGIGSAPPDARRGGDA
ncbi:MAG: biopolymer transporter ExbD [Alcanivoracaceae bacterium]|nr:biopolymer transporter ExbD [Alcanivoracaceae bacterium]